MTSLDPAAFCDQVRTRLVGALTLSCGDRHVAEELAQDALVRVWERWGYVSRLDSPEAWTFRVGLNLASSWRRRRSAERRANLRASRVRPTDVEPDVDEDVRRAVAALPERQRAVIVARYYLSYDVEGAAKLLGCAPGTVKAATHHAMNNLRASGLVQDRSGEGRRT